MSASEDSGATAIGVRVGFYLRQVFEQSMHALPQRQPFVHIGPSVDAGKSTARFGSDLSTGRIGREDEEPAAPAPRKPEPIPVPKPKPNKHKKRGAGHVTAF